MSYRTMVALVGFMLLSQGCAYNSVTGQAELKSNQDNHWDAQYAKGLESKYQNFSKYLADNYESKTDDAGRKAVRDQVITELLWLSDYYYHRDVNSLYNDDNAINFFTDVINLGLTSAATISGGTETKTVLSGIATFATGARTSYDSDYLHKETITAIINDMDKLRSAAEKSIYDNLKSSDAVYPLEPTALKDLANYEVTGVLAAVEDLQNTSKTNAATQQAETTRARLAFRRSTTQPSE
jgi:hypothetical protein